jgi:hypothetical protein
VRADFDTNANATSARQAARAALSGTGRGMLVWTMSDAVQVATPSYFEAVMLKKVLDRQPGVGAVRAEKVASSPGAPGRASEHQTGDAGVVHRDLDGSEFFLPTDQRPRRPCDSHDRIVPLWGFAT